MENKEDNKYLVYYVANKELKNIKSQVLTQKCVMVERSE